MSHRPNVLLIIMDDLGWGDLGCHGNTQVRTPHLDALHTQSVRLTRYCSGPLCTPARAALMTGRHPYRTRAIDTYLGRSCLDPGEITLASLLRQAGYRTAIVGKWHLGDCYPMRAIDMGFDEAVVHNGGGLVQPGNFGRDDYFDPDLMHNGRLTPFKGYCTDIFTEQAMRFIESCADEPPKQPWFCYLATNAPHAPAIVADRWAQPHLDAGLPEVWARFYGMVDNIDWNIGRVLRLLDERSLSDQTLVIFTSDHGPCGSISDPQRGQRWNAKLRGIKGTMHEGGIRVPCFWRWPGRFAGGRDVDRLNNPIDMLPTLATACDFATPSDRAIDGCSLLPLLTGEMPPRQWPDRTICMQWHRADTPVLYRNAAAITQHYKWYRRHENEAAELYDITNEPLEQHDLASQRSEIARGLQDEYERWFDDVSSTRPDNYAPPRIVLGTPHTSGEPAVLTRQDWRLYPGVDEAWSTDHPGYWPVRIAADSGRRFRVRITVAGVDAPAVLHFRCGAIQRRADLVPRWSMPTLSVWFDELPLEPGDRDLEAWFTSRDSDRRRGVWNVEIHAEPKAADAPV